MSQETTKVRLVSSSSSSALPPKVGGDQERERERERVFSVTKISAYGEDLEEAEESLEPWKRRDSGDELGTESHLQ